MRRGFVTIIAILLIAVVVGLVTVTYFKLSNKSAKPAADAAPELSPSPSSPVLKSYDTKFYDEFYSYGTINDGPLSTVRFKYPSDWTVSENDSKNPQKPGHYYTINGPNSFEVVLLEIPGGIGGGCPEESIAQLKKDKIFKTEPMSLNNQSLYLRYMGDALKQESEGAHIAISADLNCMDELILLKTKSGDINFGASASFLKPVPFQDFVNSAEMKVAKEIFSSIEIVD